MSEQNEAMQVIVRVALDALGCDRNRQDRLEAQRIIKELADKLKPSWTVNEVAGLRNVSSSTVTYWCRQGWLDAEKASDGSWRIYATRDELLAFEPPRPGPKAK